MLVHVDFAESYRNDISKMISKVPTLKFKGATSEIRNKSAVVVTENSDHNRITSMGRLKKAID